MVLLNRRKYFHKRRPQGAPADLADATITVPESVTYTGAPLTPSVAVVYDGATLVVNQDYFVSYNDNTEVGAATAVITGTGEFTGQVVKTFYIKAAESGWEFNVEDMVYVGSKQTECWQGSYLLAVAEDYSDGNALLVSSAFIQNRYLFGQVIPKDAQSKIHIANMVSAIESASNGSNPYFHARWVSRDGKKTYWYSNNDNKTCIPATCSTGYDFANLSFDRSSSFDKSVFAPGTSAFFFSEDGSRVFSAGGGNSYGRVWFADLSTPFDLLTVDESSASYVDITEVPLSYVNVVRSLVFSANGRNLLLSAGTSVYQFRLSNAFDLSSREFVGSKAVDGNFTGLALVNDATTLFGITSAGKVYEYDLMAAS